MKILPDVNTNIIEKLKKVINIPNFSPIEFVKGV